MKCITRTSILLVGLGLGAGLLCAQAPWPFVAQTTPDAQRNALNAVRSQVNWLQNATRTAPGYVTGGYDGVWQQFQTLRGTFTVFKSTLTHQQLNYGANDLAELDAGLDILQEAFTNCQEDVAAGQSSARAVRNLCRVLGQAAGVWLQEFNKDSARLRVGW